MAQVKNSSQVKNPPVNAGDTEDSGWIPGSGRSPEEGNGNRLQYSSLGNYGQRNLAGYSPWCRKELDTTKQLRTTHSIFIVSILFSY